MGLAYLSCSAQFPCLVGLARARDNINKAANQSTVLKPYFAEVGLFHGACLFQLLSTVSMGWLGPETTSTNPQTNPQS